MPNWLNTNGLRIPILLAAAICCILRKFRSFSAATKVAAAAASLNLTTKLEARWRWGAACSVLMPIKSALLTGIALCVAAAAISVSVVVGAATLCVVSVVLALVLVLLVLVLVSLEETSVDLRASKHVPAN